MAKIKLFAGFRERVGKDEVYIKIKEVKLREFIEILCRELPQIGKNLRDGDAIIAVNREVADEKTVVKDKDEIAIFPPVAGG